MEKAELFHLFLDNMLDAVAVYEASAEGKPLKFLEANGQMCRYLGHTHEEFLRIQPADVSFECFNINRTVWLDLLESRYLSIEYLYKTKDNRSVPIEIHYHLFHLDERNLVFLTIRDISERKKAEEKQRRLEKDLNLSSRLASVGALTAGVAHEINSPLTSILGFSERLARKCTSEEQHRDIERIHTEALRAAKVIDNLRTFARSYQQEKKLCGLNEIIRKSVELREYELVVQNIVVELELAENLPATLLDFYKIQQVLINMILNAEQAMYQAHGRGRLLIKTQNMGNYIRMIIEDNGPGISPEIAEKVFDPFFTTKEDSRGTGLGLSVCYGIIMEHDGKIQLESKLGQGTRFIIDLPVKNSRISRKKAAEVVVVKVNAKTPAKLPKSLPQNLPD
ncbi:MAG: ATP-binding protein [Dehalococcoides mccartyi]|uniref:two-component system sensor histidine kinase NtrB n=1 Tax=Dehalococcoides TaxID=61434 RepID=UPI0019E3A2F6|nr:ATP-binding protein [Dehalococcoides mccartyi]MBF4482011.1 PAS domain S-box protein [Dehalococcoides mccartyi]MBJ7531367.1 PAS domain S-box protein [Dehalococcoides mccartyi]MDP4279083.1 ATP-binding protein [Dehalococcoides mccartyi]